MKNINQSLVLIGMGVLNLFHAALHFFQFIQSAFLFASAINGCSEESGIEKFLHNPYMALVWAIVGVLTLYIGIRDFRHHRKCK